MKQSRTAWIAAPILLITWIVLGYFFDNSSSLGWLPKWAVAAAVIAPAAWIFIYTFQGLVGIGKWWQNDVGTNMVWLEIAAIGGNGYIAWAQFFNHGLLNTPAQAWGYIGCLIAGALIITWRSIIWLGRSRHQASLVSKIKELEEENVSLRKLEVNNSAGQA